MSPTNFLEVTADPARTTIEEVIRGLVSQASNPANHVIADDSIPGVVRFTHTHGKDAFTIWAKEKFAETGKPARIETVEFEFSWNPTYPGCETTKVSAQSCHCTSQHKLARIHQVVVTYGPDDSGSLAETRTATTLSILVKRFRWLSLERLSDSLRNYGLDNLVINGWEEIKSGNSLEIGSIEDLNTAWASIFELASLANPLVPATT